MNQDEIEPAESRSLRILPKIESLIMDDDCSGKPTAVNSDEPTTPRSDWSPGDDENINVTSDFESSRGKFKSYWNCAADVFGLTYDGMMLKRGTDIEGFSESDSQEITAWISENISFPVKQVLELGAGIGRFTGVLKKFCEEITVVDFIKGYIERNKELHFDPINRPKDVFLEADATKLVLPDASYDFIFWNWLLMYLSDGEIKDFIQNVLRWLKVGGFLFCRESCGEPSDKNHNRPWAVEGNPTEYRPVQFYTWLLTEFVSSSGIEVELIFKERPVTIYSQKVKTEGQCCWLIKRIS